MINNMQRRFDEIESSSLLKEIQVDAFEISKLFYYNFINNIIVKKRNHLNGWNKFTSKLMVRS